jgi:2-polyprenyl-3-methyl-5-hydroxy-6-metoxy-1,4-benzoquinol methylase
MLLLSSVESASKSTSKIPAQSFQYSTEFYNMIVQLHRGKENWPNYAKYLEAHMGGPHSRLRIFFEELCPEIQYHCGSLQHKRILDFGCGTGASSVALAQFTREVVAYDIDSESIRICQQRVFEHGMEPKVSVFAGNDIAADSNNLGKFDIIVMNGVLEHMPLTTPHLRAKIIQKLWTLLEDSGYLVVNETPNRLYPFDFHSTQLWWIPWTQPGSKWAYEQAVSKGRHSDAPTISPGPLGLEEVGAWGATYWEILTYLKEKRFVCVNVMDGHSRHITFVRDGGWQRQVFEFFLYYTAVKICNIPLTALAPMLTNLVIKKLPAT